MVRLTPRSRERPRRVFLHIGAMKTGTTYLQNLMSANKATLLAQQVLFPGQSWADQSWAARDVLGFKNESFFAVRSDGMWRQITTEILESPAPTAVFSMEFLSYAEPETARTIVDSFPGSEVHVVLTVRDAIKAFPAQWQTQCTNMGRATWPRFLQTARAVIEQGDASGGSARRFERTQNIPRMLDTWAPLVAPGHLHVVTVPRSTTDRRLLWRRFATVLGVDERACPVDPKHVNTSMGYPSAEVLRRVNATLDEVPRAAYDLVIKARLGRDVLAPRARSERPILLHRPGYNLAAGWNDAVLTAISDTRADIVGDLADLPTDRAGDDVPQRLQKPEEHELLTAAAVAHDALLAQRAALSGGATDAIVDPTTPDHWAGRADPWDAAVEDVAALAAQCIDLVDASQAPGEPDPSRQP